MTKKLPGLDGLRAVAAITVLIGHVYQIAGLMGDKEMMHFYFKISRSGKNMVTLFFVISGFIITYLLLGEKNRTGTISLLQFYKKRALRIWPIYFLMLAFVLPLTYYTNVYQAFGSFDTTSILCVVFFVVNVGNVLDVPMGVLPHYWSLSVEEQFYLFWPAALRKIKPLTLCITVFVSLIVFRNTASLMWHIYKNNFWADVNNFLQQTLFSCMAVGGILAVAFYEQWRVLDYFRLPAVHVLSWVLFFTLSYSNVYIPYVHSEVLAIVYAVIILNAISGKTPLLDKKPFQFLGKISYGIYMYHWPLIPIIIFGLQKLGINRFFGFYGLPLILLSTVITIALAQLSFILVEQPFLRLKNRKSLKTEFAKLEAAEQ